MKRAVSISLGSSTRDKAVEIELLGERVWLGWSGRRHRGWCRVLGAHRCRGVGRDCRWNFSAALGLAR